MGKPFSDVLRQKLLTDDYGGWKNIDPIVLQDLCDRIAVETEEYINLQNSHLKQELSRLRLSVNELQRDKANLIQTCKLYHT